MVNDVFIMVLIVIGLEATIAFFGILYGKPKLVRIMFAIILITYTLYLLKYLGIPDLMRLFL